MKAITIPYGRQTISDEDVEAVASALKGELITGGGGAMVLALENALTKVCRAQYAVACASGTAAFHLAAMALDLRERDAVIVPAITFLATANCVRYAGAEVVFADVDPTTGLMTAETLDVAIARARELGLRVRAIIPVHYAGQVVELRDFARFGDLALIEDAAHALGSAYGDSAIDGVVGDCRYSAMTILSFHPVKTITSGEGGAILTNDDRVARRLRNLRNHGMTRNSDEFKFPTEARTPDSVMKPWYYEMAELGLNYRLSDIHSALGVSQLRRLNDFIVRRREIVTLYDELFTDIKPIASPLRKLTTSEPAWHLYVLLVDYATAAMDRSAFMRALAAEGVGTQVHYIPVYRQPYYLARYGAIHLDGAEAFYERTISLPLFPTLTNDEVRAVARLTMSILKGERC